jgi:enoyl-CoA hydratase/carnithine racemase
MSDRVTVHLHGHVADVRLSRADKLNALDYEMFTALIDTGRSLAKTRGVRAVVLSGEGRAFSAGLDFASFMAMAASDDGAPSLLNRDGSSVANTAQLAAYVWKELPVPVIAAVHGVCYGGGLQIAAGADIRLVHPDAKLSIREMHWGLVPDMSGTRTLKHLLRSDVLKELTFTARIVSGTEAVALGLGTRTSDDPHADALELARQIASASPTTMRAAKKLIDEAYAIPDDATGLALEEKLQRTLLGSANQMEAVQANMEKRPAVYADPE